MLLYSFRVYSISEDLHGINRSGVEPSIKFTGAGPFNKKKKKNLSVFQINHRIDTCHFNVFSRILKENLHFCNLKSF
ncbi:BnaC06g06290D [Brassica napus]|uniref:BnaC06g06290D protein n=1 Tax=Brassica napus TaxID=3708 RepID=A0A078GHR5_BRANA|nr:BnaC06g06290D [Brassica napus]